MNPRRIDLLAHPQNRPLLVLEKRNLVAVIADSPGVGIPVQQVLDIRPRQRRFDDRRHVLQLDLGIEHLLRLDQQERPHLAETVAARGMQGDPIDQIVLEQVALHRLQDGGRAAGAASRPGADCHVQLAPVLVFQEHASQPP